MTETVIAPDRNTYIRAHTWMAALAMAGAMAVLWFMGNPHVWTGAVAGLAAIGIRCFYVMDEAMAERWTLTRTTLEGPSERRYALADIETVRSFGSAVQIITKRGDKQLIKYLASPDDVVDRIQAALP